jgi:hypothetical protein
MPSKSSDRRRLRDTRRAMQNARIMPHIEASNDQARVQPKPTIPRFSERSIDYELQQRIDASLKDSEASLARERQRRQTE